MNGPIQDAVRISVNGLLLLRGTLGSHWSYYAGEHLLSDGLVPERLIVGTSHGPLTILGEYVQAPSEEYLPIEDSETFGKFAVTSSDEGIAVAKRKGNIYYQHAGEVIQDVVVMTDTVTEFTNGEPTYVLEIDMAIVFMLETGVIAVKKDNYHLEFMTVERAKSLADYRFIEGPWEWRDTLIKTHTMSRKFTSLAGNPENEPIVTSAVG